MSGMSGPEGKDYHGGGGTDGTQNCCSDGGGSDHGDQTLAPVFALTAALERWGECCPLGQPRRKWSGPVYQTLPDQKANQ
jgi:hypothetical protein